MARRYVPRGLYKVGTITGEERAPYFTIKTKKRYVNPAQIPIGTILTVVAKKHAKTFVRNPPSKPPGHPLVKDIFTGCAEKVAGQTKNVYERAKLMRECIIKEFESRNIPKVTETKKA